MDFEKLFPEQFEFFAKSVEEGKIRGAYIFWGPDGIGKEEFAIFVARGFLCGTMPPCGFCSQCIFQEHPDIMVIRKKPEDERIKAEYVRDAIKFSLIRPISHHKFIIFSDAHLMTPQGFSALLKTIEEPYPFSSFFLITSKLEMIPPTIVSRCIKVRFSIRNLQKVISEKVREKFQSKELVEKATIISFLNPNMPDIIQDGEELQRIWEMIESVIVGEGEYKLRFIRLLDEFIKNDRDMARKFLAGLESFIAHNPEKFGRRAIGIWENIKRARILVELFIPPKFALLTLF
jgi:hypothetical protein